jgi:hypothetical protein
MTNEEVKARKFEIQKRVQQLSANIGNPTVRYQTPNGEQLAKEELGKLITEYRALPVEEVEVTTLTMGKIIALSDDRYILKYIQGSKRWDFYEGSQYKTSNVEWLDESTAKVSVPTTNSDTHGETVNYVFRVKVAPTVDPLVANLAKPQPLPHQPLHPENKITPNKDDLLMKGLGYIIDANTGRWRKQTTQEYDEKQQQQKIESKKEEKKKRFFK